MTSHITRRYRHKYTDRTWDPSTEERKWCKMTEGDTNTQVASTGSKLGREVSLLAQTSVESGFKDAESSLSSSACSPLKLHSGIEPFRDDPDAAQEPLRVSAQQETAMVHPSFSTLTNVGNGLSEQSVAETQPGYRETQLASGATQPGYRETQLASGASLVVGCDSEVQAAVAFPVHTPQSGDVAKDHKITGLEETLQNEIRNRKELEEQLALATSEKDELEAELVRVKRSCELEVNALKFNYDSKCKELEECRLTLADKERELDGLNEQWSKEVKEARAQADKKVVALKEEYDCKVSELKREAEKKDSEQLQLQIQIEKTKRECDNKVKDLELNIEVKKREIAEKDKELALKGAEISKLESEVIVRREKEEKEALRRDSEATIKALKQDNASLKDQLVKYRSGSCRNARNSSSDHDDYM